MQDAAIRSADILSALSYALDLVEGQPVGHAVRTCLIAMRIAEHLELSEAEKTDLYFAALLKDSGCTTNSVKIQQSFGDDHGAKREVKLIDWTKKLDCILYGLNTVHRDRPLSERLRRVVALLSDPEAGMVAMTRVRCDRGAQIALHLGFGSTVAEAVRSLDEHWDGFGAPCGLKGEAIPILARILGVAQTLDVMARGMGRSAAYRVLRRRSKRWFDPQIVASALSLELDEPFWQGLKDEARTNALESATPATVRLAGTAGIDSTCDAFAEIIDAKSSFTASHSTRVALEEDIAAPPYTNGGTALAYLLLHGLSSVGARVNAIDLLTRFLTTKGAPHRPDRSASKLHGLMLDAQPRWLDVPTEYLEPLLRETEGLGRHERKAALRSELLARFRCVKSPPRWLQNPAWPFVEGRPTLFVGQLGLGTPAHDETQIYVFVDEATGEFRTVVQAA